MAVAKHGYRTHPNPNPVLLKGAIEATSTLSLLEMWRLPMVKEVAATYFCVNVLRYAVTMWLPIFLQAKVRAPATALTDVEHVHLCTRGRGDLG